MFGIVKHHILLLHSHCINFLSKIGSESSELLYKHVSGKDHSPFHLYFFLKKIVLHRPYNNTSFREKWILRWKKTDIKSSKIEQ